MENKGVHLTVPIILEGSVCKDVTAAFGSNVRVTHWPDQRALVHILI